MTKSVHPAAAARVKLADKMVMLPLLFDGTKPEVVKQHYERFNQYIKFQTKSGNIRDPIGEAVELFEHTLDKKALVWFQEHKDKFLDLTTLKTMFLQRYYPWGKTKRDQLQSWNILTFNPKKTDVDEHIDLINTLGDMLGQTEESKMEKFIETMPTIIQTHLITKKTWQETTDKVKELEHIIRKCDPLAAALPNLAKGTTVPSYIHTEPTQMIKRKQTFPNLSKGPTLSNPSKEVEEKVNSLNKNQKIHQYRYRTISKIMKILTIITITRIIKVNPEDIDPIEAKIQVNSLEATIHVAEVNKIRIHTRANIKMIAIRATIMRAIEDFIITHAGIFLIAMAILEVEAMAEAEVIIKAMVVVGLIIEVMLAINTISIMVMMISTRQINMVHHVHYVVATITLLNIASRESMISMILWKR